MSHTSFGMQPSATPMEIDCKNNGVESLKAMFVDLVQQGRIDAGQCPALRPVFHKTHGIIHGELVMRDGVAAELRPGIFSAERYPVRARISSDTSPSSTGYKSTIGFGVKLFGVAGEKLIDNSDDTTFDMIFQNHDVFFVDTAQDMCSFTRAALIDGTIDEYFAEHPTTKIILDEMAKPEASTLSAIYWSILPFSFGPSRFAKFRLSPNLKLEPPSKEPDNGDYLEHDLAQRLKNGEVQFELSVQVQTNTQSMPLDRASVRWETAESPFIPIADLNIPQQDITNEQNKTYGENLAFNIWRVTEDFRPQGSIARARQSVYRASARLRRTTNNVPDMEPEEY